MFTIEMLKEIVRRKTKRQLLSRLQMVGTGQQEYIKNYISGRVWNFKNTPISRDWLPNEIRGLRITHDGTHGADVTWRRVIGTAGAKYFIVGDAAVVLDPASSHGISRAVMSGIMAGHAINKILSDRRRKKCRV
jgi:flavin-dependent dehydrogenase